MSEATPRWIDAVLHENAQSLVVHGLLYDLASGNIEVVVNGYEAP